MPSRPRQRRNRWHGDIVAEDQWRRTGAAAAAVENDVVDTDFERRIDVLLDVLRRQA